MYDNNGNIIKEREFAFTLKDNTMIEEMDSEDKVYAYKGDQLFSYNAESCEYGQAIGDMMTGAAKDYIRWILFKLNFSKGFLESALVTMGITMFSGTFGEGIKSLK